MANLHVAAQRHRRLDDWLPIAASANIYLKDSDRSDLSAGLDIVSTGGNRQASLTLPSSGVAVN